MDYLNRLNDDVENIMDVIHHKREIYLQTKPDHPDYLLLGKNRVMSLCEAMWPMEKQSEYYNDFSHFVFCVKNNFGYRLFGLTFIVVENNSNMLEVA